MNNYQVTIGIEVHVELNTKYKSFSTMYNAYGKEANTLINEIDLGMPGTLPTLNKEVLDAALKAALVLNCDIAKEMHFDRKNYFYPDLPKGYQITQANTPIGTNGFLVVGDEKIRIERVHIEEDTAKSIHDQDKTYLDYNRAGVPLIEIVTAPVIKNSEIAMMYLEKLRETLLFLGISDVKMEEGSMRCDVNISLSNNDELGTKVEIKNMGSIKSVGLAIEYEIKRQLKMIENGEIIVEETRRYDDNTKSTILMRVKETGNDYRYFPEPDIPSIIIDDEWLQTIQKDLPKTADEIRNELRVLGVNENNVNALINDPEGLAYYECLSNLKSPKIAINLIITELKSYQNQFNKSLIEILDPNLLVNIVNDISDGKYNNQIAKKILLGIILDKKSYQEMLDKYESVNDINIEQLIDEVIKANPDAIKDYFMGKDRAFKHLMGQAMKISQGRANASEVTNKLKEELDKLSVK